MRSAFKLVYVAVAILSLSACGGSSPKPMPVTTSTAPARPPTDTAVASPPPKATASSPTALPTYAVDPNRICAGYGIAIGISFAGGTVRAYQVNPARPEQAPLLLDLVWPPGYSIREGPAGPEIASPDGSIVIRDNALIDAGVCPQSGGKLFLEDLRPDSISNLDSSLSKRNPP